MGNCQAAEAVAVVIQHPSDGRVERAHRVVTAAAVMAANPGHYVAAVIAAAPPAPATPPKQRLKLLRPDDTLVLGGVYRLLSFEEVLREFVSKRHAMLSRVLIAADDEEEGAAPAEGKAAHRRRGDGCYAPSASELDGALAKVELQRSGGEEMSTKVKRPVGIVRRAILHRPHTMEYLHSKQGSEHRLKDPTSDPSDPSSDDGSPSGPIFDAVAMAHGMVLGGRFGLSRHGQWRPALPSIAEGSVVC